MRKRMTHESIVGKRMDKKTPRESMIGVIVSVIVTLLGGYFLLVSTDKLPWPPFSSLPVHKGSESVGDPKVIIREQWVEFNVTEKNQKGTRIHITFEIQGYKGIDCYAAAYFSGISGNKLLDKNGLYRAGDGQVSTRLDFKPPYESAVYEDLPLFIPDEELHVGPGERQLKYLILIHRRNSGKLLASTGPYLFQNDDPRQIIINNIAPEQFAIVDGKVGLKIHISITAINLKGTPCYATAYFFRVDDNEPLKDSNNQYNTDNGKVAAITTFTPKEDSATIKDLHLFLPYEELHITKKGKYKLKFSTNFFLADTRENITSSCCEFFDYTKK